jgi:predicted NACHT family NTPase
MSSLGGGGDDEAAVTLEQVYTQLDTETPLGHVFDDTGIETLFERYADDDEKKLRGAKRKTALNEARDAKIPALIALAHCPKLIVLGDPGGGKSALVEQVAAGLAALRLKLPAKMLDEFQDGDFRARHPVLITLRDLAQRLNITALSELGETAQSRALIGVVRDQIRADLRDVYLAEGAFDKLEQHLSTGLGYLIFDGLDEVPEATRPYVRKAVFAALKQYQGARVVITCRKRSYDASLGYKGFREITLAPYDKEKIKAYIEAWYRHQTPAPFTPEQADRRIADLTAAALGDHKELSPNPMLLTTMAVVHRDNERLPAELVELYDKAIDVLLRRWQRNKDMRGACKRTARQVRSAGSCSACLQVKQAS